MSNNDKIHIEQIISRGKKVLHPLETLVKVVNASVDSKIPIIINVKGTIITGDLVSLKEFHDHLSDTMISGAEDETVSDTVRSVRDVVKAMKDMG